MNATIAAINTSAAATVSLTDRQTQDVFGRGQGEAEPPGVVTDNLQRSKVRNNFTNEKHLWETTVSAKRGSRSARTLG